MYDPCIGDCFWIQALYPTYYFFLNNNAILNLDDDTLEAARELSENCGFNAVSFCAEYINRSATRSCHLSCNQLTRLYIVLG